MEPKDRQTPPDARAQHRAYVLEHVVDGGLTIEQAAQILKLSTRQVGRLLVRYRDELRYIFIVSQVDVVRSDEGASGVVVKVRAADGKKCERCWNYSTRVGESALYPDVCERCVTALDEIEQETAPLEA